jgi:putative ABC transport system permease protein
MFMAVLERTREIGIMKAIGADGSTVMKIFIMESALIGLMGGAIGIAISVTISFVIAAFGMPSKVTLELVAFAALFSLGVGVLSGYFPAKRAAELQVVDALRYE